MDQLSKPIIFFSHSSKDKDVLCRLKDLFVEKTGGSIDVFLSSDGQSIPLGKNWVHKVEEALNQAKLMFIFITPNSVRSSWVCFEAGFAYSKKIRVVPVGCLGTDIAAMNPPLSLLQGFNISNKDGLDNLIAISNDEFKHKHNLFFSENEYKEFMSNSSGSSSHPLGNYLQIVEDISVLINVRDFSLLCGESDVLERAKSSFKNFALESKDCINGIESFGISIKTYEGSFPKPIDFILDPNTIDKTLPCLIEIFKAIRADGINCIPINFVFSDGITCIEKRHKLTARLIDTDVVLETEDFLGFKNYSFLLSHFSKKVPFSNPQNPLYERGATYISIFPKKNNIYLEDVKELLDLLFSKGVFFDRLGKEIWNIDHYST
ncbi:MAG: toll/interleukin-1 receptor domain-containing protein [Candidatus Wallbacteria bacterium]|nr:toll/interleukin-1 receptor domain-containing protein [Candidatus Wallbacteria bacterium]